LVPLQLLYLNIKSGKQICLSDFFINLQAIWFIFKHTGKIRFMKKRIKSFVYAGRGILSVFKSEPNMKIHFIVTILVLICGFVFKISLTEWLLCLLCIGLVLGVEMINTSIENVVNLVSPDQHPLAGKAKDAAAGAVLICAIFSSTIGLLIFIPKVWSLLYTIL